MIPDILVSLYRAIRYDYFNIRNLNVIDSGLDLDGIPFIKLQNGMVFFGYPTGRYDSLFYRNIFRNSQTPHLREEAVSVAIEVSHRFFRPIKLTNSPYPEWYSALRKGDNVMECGGFIGFHAMRLATIVGYEGRILVVEPMPNNFKLLVRNISENNLTQMTPLHYAIWNEPGIARFFVEEQQVGSLINNVIDSKKKFQVERQTIDNIIKSQNINTIHLIRIQINGAEIEAINGMRDTLEKKPKLIITTRYRNESSAGHKMSVVNQLSDYGYKFDKFENTYFAY